MKMDWYQSDDMGGEVAIGIGIMIVGVVVEIASEGFWKLRVGD